MGQYCARTLLRCRQPDIRSAYLVVWIWEPNPGVGVNRSMRKSKDNHSEGFGDELQTATICHATRLLPLIATVRSTAVACIHRLSPPTLFESWAGVGTFKNPNLPPTQLPQPPSNLAGTRGKSSKLKPSVAPGQRTNDGGLREESDIKTRLCEVPPDLSGSGFCPYTARTRK